MSCGEYEDGEHGCLLMGPDPVDPVMLMDCLTMARDAGALAEVRGLYTYLSSGTAPGPIGSDYYYLFAEGSQFTEIEHVSDVHGNPERWDERHCTTITAGTDLRCRSVHGANCDH